MQVILNLPLVTVEQSVVDLGLVERLLLVGWLTNRPLIIGILVYQQTCWFYKAATVKVSDEHHLAALGGSTLFRIHDRDHSAIRCLSHSQGLPFHKHKPWKVAAETTVIQLISLPLASSLAHRKHRCQHALVTHIVGMLMNQSSLVAITEAPRAVTQLPTPF